MTNHSYEGLIREFNNKYKIYDPIEVLHKEKESIVKSLGLFYAASYKADQTIDAFLIFTEPNADGLGKIAHGETVKLIYFENLISHSKPTQIIEKSKFLCK